MKEHGAAPPRTFFTSPLGGEVDAPTGRREAPPEDRLRASGEGKSDHRESLAPSPQPSPPRGEGAHLRSRQNSGNQATNALEFDCVTLRIAGRTVLRDTTFSIDPGEFIGVLGPNGAGKTTLMRAILGLLPPDAGEIRVLGRSPRRGNQAIGYLPQTRTLLPDLRMRGRNFIAASLHGERLGLPALSRAEHADIDEALALIGARELAERPLGEMSGGERQRLLLAQALIGSPKLLLLDEPLISLDARHQDSVVDVVRKVSREHGITVLFSAHELNQLIGALDRVLYLGNMQAALGTVEEVITAPVLSRLYGGPINVVRAEGHIFVMSRGRDVEHVEHVHEHR